MRQQDDIPVALCDYLAGHTVICLQKLARLILTEPPRRKADIIDALERAIKDPVQLRPVWKGLDALQQAAVSEALFNGLKLDPHGFQAKYGDVPRWGELTRSSKEKPTGLYLFMPNGSTIPKDVAPLLRQFVPEPRTTKIRVHLKLPESVTTAHYRYDPDSYRTRRVEAVPLTCAVMERAVPYDLDSVLRLVEAGKVRVSEKTRRVTAAGARAITAVLYGGDFYEPSEVEDPWVTKPGPIRAFAWPLLLQAGRFVSVTNGKLELTSTGKRALTAPVHKTIQTIWKRWLKSTLLDEMNRVSAIRGQTGKGKRHLTAVGRRRQAILKALTQCPTSQWIAFDEFSRYMQAEGHRFEVSRDPWTLYLSNPQYGTLGYSGFSGWNILQERYMLAFFFEYVATLGLIDVAYIHPSSARNDCTDLWDVDDLDCLSRYDGLMYFRINGLGAWCLGLMETYEPPEFEEAPALRVLPNRDIVMTDTMAAGDKLFLDRIAKQTSESVWRLDEQTLLKLVEAGQSIADVERFLQTKVDGGIPDNVTVFLEDLKRRASQLTASGPALLIEVKDPILAQQLANESQLRSLCMLAGERHLAVPSDSEAKFRRALRRLGYVLGGSSR